MPVLKEYRDSACPTLAALITQSPDPDDAITFSVLTRIAARQNAVTFSDGEEILICHSAHPYPVWVYVRAPFTAEKIRTVADCLSKQLPLSCGYHYNLTPALYEALCTYDSRFSDTRLKMGLISHRLDKLAEIRHPCDGNVSLARETDVLQLTGIWHDLSFEMEGFDFPADVCRQKVLSLLADNALYVWRNDADRIVAVTARRPFGVYGKISAVYTLPAFRRRGYAINLVHFVTQTLLRDGMIPILYTDGGYVPSNACYAKIGYREVGRLCTIGADS